MSSHELEARIRKIEDIHEIKNLEARYVYLVDTLQIDKLPDLFADIFTIDFGHLGTFNTKEAFVDFLNGARTNTSMMRHQEMTPLIEVDGDKATGTWYLFGLFTHVMPQGEVANWMQGRLDNEYVRVDGKWKYSVRKFTFTLHTPYEDGWVKTPMMSAQG